ncbi:GNAT family protein [Ammonicoccus fulvus]|uniref:GNAT family protein n=1 Tax=Ammonicoccus fulvus TaxID=3138240 RepID=A0ABZ3FPT6_9ACTN
MTEWPVQLTHGEAVLRPMRRRDQRDWDEVRSYNRDWLHPWEATMPPGGEPGPATFGALVKLLDRQARQGQGLPWALCWNPAGGDPGRARLVGQVTVTGISRGSARFAQIGYWIDRRLAGRGLVPLGVALATDFCFRDLRLHRMEVAIRPENGNSLRVVQKLGFRYEGLRPRYLHINGDWRDHEVFALNAEEVPEGMLARWQASRTPR